MQVEAHVTTLPNLEIKYKMFYKYYQAADLFLVLVE
jgi:hypothetical protein